MDVDFSLRDRSGESQDVERYAAAFGSTGQTSTILDKDEIRGRS